MNRKEFLSTIFMILGTCIFLRTLKILFIYGLREAEPQTLDTLYSIENAPHIDFDKAKIFLTGVTLAALIQALSSTLALGWERVSGGAFRRFFLGIDLLMFLSLFCVLLFQYTQYLDLLFEVMGVNLLLLILGASLEFFPRGTRDLNKRRFIVKTLQNANNVQRDSIADTVISAA